MERDEKRLVQMVLFLSWKFLNGWFVKNLFQFILFSITEHCQKHMSIPSFLSPSLLITCPNSFYSSTVSNPFYSSSVPNPFYSSTVPPTHFIHSSNFPNPFYSSTVPTHFIHPLSPTNFIHPLSQPILFTHHALYQTILFIHCPTPFYSTAVPNSFYSPTVPTNLYCPPPIFI